MVAATAGKDWRMKRILVIGRTGQLAQSLAECAAEFPGLAIDFAARPEIDLGRIDEACAALQSRPFDVLVNASAYNDVDGAERAAAAAFAINAEAPGRLAALASGRGAPFLHFSTDYVFPGGGAPYRETDATNPLGRYGASKLEGERRVATANPRHLVFRTAWIFSPFAKNFLKTVLIRAAEQDEMRIVSDQRSSPTGALDLARATLQVIEALGPDDTRWGLYHLAGATPASRFELAEAIVAASRRLGGPTCRLIPISASEFPTVARRPGDSSLDSGQLAKAFGVRVPGYENSLPSVVARILAGRTGSA